MEAVTFGQMVKQIPVRFAEVIVKLLSVKGVVLGLTTFLSLKGVLDPWMVFGVFLVVIFGREAFKIIQEWK